MNIIKRTAFIGMLIAALFFAVPGFSSAVAVASDPTITTTSTATATATAGNNIVNLTTGSTEPSKVTQTVGANTQTVEGGRQTVGGNTQTVISERDFLGNPLPANVNLINYTGPYRSLYVGLAPWELATVWNADNLKGFDTCFWGCSTKVSAMMTAKESKSFKIGKGKRVLAIVIATGTDPMAMWGNVATEAMKRGATSVELKSMISKFKTTSTGASFYLSGGISAVRGDGTQAVAGSSGIGFGTASAETIEMVSAVFVLYIN